jgi:7-cyano-7-deazaguanine synthase
MSELLLLSGGIDSTAVAAWRRPALCVTIDYGQRSAEAEIRAAAQICRDLGLTHDVLTARIPSIGSGDLTGESPSAHSPHSDFWPFRNQYLITLASMIAMKDSYDTVLIGTVCTDVRHRDGSQEFLAAINHLLEIQEGNLRLHAPASDLTSEELVRCSLINPATLAWSHSCHVGNLACGRCRGCQKHLEVTRALGWPT